MKTLISFADGIRDKRGRDSVGQTALVKEVTIGNTSMSLDQVGGPKILSKCNDARRPMGKGSETATPSRLTKVRI